MARLLAWAIAKAADDDAVKKSARFQRRIKLIRRSQTDVAAILDLDDVAVVSRRGQIVQHLVERQDPQLIRHSVAAEVGVGRLARTADKLPASPQDTDPRRCDVPKSLFRR